MQPHNNVLIRGGIVVDGTGAPARRADVLVRDGRIAAVKSELTVDGRARVIDADGLRVAPGFIDTHSHSDLRVLVEPDLPMKVMQGITLDVLGQDGISVAPVRDEDVEQVRKQLAGLLGDPDVERQWRSVADYLVGCSTAAPGSNLRLPGAARRGARRRDGARRAQAGRRRSWHAWWRSSSRRWRRGRSGCRRGSSIRPAATARPTSWWRCARRWRGATACSSCTCAPSRTTSSAALDEMIDVGRAQRRARAHLALQDRGARQLGARRGDAAAGARGAGATACA